MAGVAVLDTRLRRIVEGAVGMVDHTLSSLGERDIVDLDEERKAAMVANLMVVLVGDRGAQPVVNSGRESLRRAGRLPAPEGEKASGPSGRPHRP